eukprot:TRINITY_DN27621_c0_g1_i1.p1 TRINITY_DN27621_c0_g1~~TRINITY_DN27621_c0_g1_i1.p1  ORF type:complete len:363 (+),score=96.11 TRINITY_DN27621_c0_g1_i1:76-1089(+)
MSDAAPHSAGVRSAIDETLAQLAHSKAAMQSRAREYRNLLESKQILERENAALRRQLADAEEHLQLMLDATVSAAPGRERDPARAPDAAEQLTFFDTRAHCRRVDSHAHLIGGGSPWRKVQVGDPTAVELFRGPRSPAASPRALQDWGAASPHGAPSAGSPPRRAERDAARASIGGEAQQLTPRPDRRRRDPAAGAGSRQRSASTPPRPAAAGPGIPFLLAPLAPPAIGLCDEDAPQRAAHRARLSTILAGSAGVLAELAQELEAEKRRAEGEQRKAADRAWQEKDWAVYAEAYRRWQDHLLYEGYTHEALKLVRVLAQLAVTPTAAVQAETAAEGA